MKAGVVPGEQDRLLGAAGVLGFKAVLDWTYVAGVAPVFPDEGFVHFSEPGRILLSWVLTGVVALMVRSRVRRPSDLLLVLLAATPVLPALTLYAFRGDALGPAVAGVMALAIVGAIRNVRWPALRPLVNGPSILGVASTIAVAVTLGTMVMRGATTFMTLDLAAVYAVREFATEQVAGGAIAYLGDWSAKVFIPALAALALVRGARGWALGALLLEIPLALFTAQKGPLGLLLLLLLVFLLRKSPLPGTSLLAAFTIPIAVSVLLWVVAEQIMPLAVFTRRVFFVPAHLNFAYARLFDDIGYVAFRTVIPSIAGPYPFALPPAMLVGDFLVPNSGMWANTGFIGAGWMHAGFLGVALYAVVIGALLGLADALTGPGREWPALLILVPPFTTLFTSSDLPTGLLTHGIALCLISLLLIQDWSAEPNLSGSTA